MRLSGRRADAGTLLGISLLSGGVGFVGSSRPLLGLLVILGMLTLCLVAVRPVLCAVLALPCVYGIQSLGAQLPLGLTDLVIAAAALLALPALTRTAPRPGLQSLALAFGFYLCLLLPSLIAAPTSAAAQELVHRVLIVLAAAVVGAWLVLEERVTPALRLFVLVSVFFAFASVLTWLSNGQQPAYPLGYHKNYVGTLLALTLIVVLCLRDRLRLPAALRGGAAVALVLGVLACQSRGAFLGLVLGGLIWLFAPRRGSGVRGRARLAAAVMAVGFGLYAAQSVQDQLTSGDVETNSVGVRRDVEAFTRDLWRTSPWDGVGLRYFTSGDFGPLAQPSNNAINNELVEAGIFGATGFVAFHLVALRLLWRRRRNALGLTALALLSGQLLHGMFDIYWSSGITPLPFMLAGMALAAGDEVPTAPLEPARPAR